MITLLIIGVVASLTIPVISRKIQEADLKVAFKKTYSEIDQATEMIAANHDGTIKGLCGDWDEACLANNYRDNMRTLKSCYNGGSGDLLGNCWHWDGDWSYLNGTKITGWVDGDTDSGLVLSNGVLLDFMCTHELCDYNVTSPDYPAGTFKVCGIITADVNGFKPPNIVGKDIFRIYIQEDSNKPGGFKSSEYDIDTYPCDTSTRGWSCALKVLQGN